MSVYTIPTPKMITVALIKVNDNVVMENIVFDSINDFKEIMNYVNTNNDVSNQPKNEKDKNEIIEEQQKEEEKHEEDPKAENEIVEDDENEIVEDEEDEYEEVPICLEEKIKEKYTNQNTQKSYLRWLNRFLDAEYDFYNADDEKEIKRFYELYKSYSPSSLKQGLSLLLFITNELNVNNNNIKNELNKLRDKCIVNTHNNELKDIEKAKLVFNKLKNDKHENHADKFYCYFINEFGVLRTDEFRSIKLLNFDVDEDNYYDASSNSLIFNNHKTKNTYGQKVIELDEVCKTLIEKMNDDNQESIFGYTSNDNFYQYSRADKLSHHLKMLTGFGNTELRKMKTSITLCEGNQEKIETLSYIQGHSVLTQTAYYGKYKNINH